MTNSIFSPGKLMLTSEYFALDGALVLAVPTKPGQELFYSETLNQKTLIFWEAYHQNKLWLKITIDYSTWQVIETNLIEAAQFVVKVLKIIQEKSATKFQNKSTTYHLKTNLQFPADYGLGSSSTLMNNLAEWANTNPFMLNELSLGGSGYDIAVAKMKSPILFRSKPTISYEKIDFLPTFKSELIFIHLNQKQDSRVGIKAYRDKEKPQSIVDEFSELTLEIIRAKKLETFSELMKIHEDKISTYLGIEKAKEKHFKECPVFIKSLGAWGGDFVMSQKFEGYREWFSKKGFETIFDYNYLIS